MVKLVERLVERGLTLGSPPLLDTEATRHRVEPGSQRGIASEVTDGARHGHQRILRHIFGVFGIAAHAHAETEDLFLVLLQKCRERGAIAGPCCGQQIGFRPSFICHVV